MSIVHRSLARVKEQLAKVTLLIEFCHDCGRKQPLVWTVTDELWAEFAEGQKPLCPECFDRRARKAGLLLRWVPVVDGRASDEGSR